MRNERKLNTMYVGRYVYRLQSFFLSLKCDETTSIFFEQQQSKIMGASKND